MKTLLWYQQQHHHRKFVQILLLLICTIYIIICPYNKVEESFNIQATHDLFYYGIQPAIQQQIYNTIQQQNYYFQTITTTTINTTFPFIHTSNHTTGTLSTLTSTTIPASSSSSLPYDHLQYPGVVPRTFVGSFLLCIVIKILQYCILYPIYDIGQSPYIVQFLFRLLLLYINLIQLYNMSYAIDTLQQQQIHYNNITKHTISSTTTTTTNTTMTTKTTTNTEQQQTQQNGMIGTYMILITCCQFHLPYYLSRTLPNTFACILTIRTFTYWITHISKQQQSQSQLQSQKQKQHSQTTTTTISYDMIGAMIDLLAATIVFRCDCLLLIISLGITWLLTKQITIYYAILFGTIISISILLLTVPVDSILWQRLVWPEGEVLYYNTILNKSSNWGISVWHWYFTSALPKALLFSIFLVPLSFLKIPEGLAYLERRIRYGSGISEKSSSKSISNGTYPKATTTKSNTVLNRRLDYYYYIDTRYIQFVLPAIGFVILYSNLGHKEVRFLYPVLPLFNFAAAIGMNRIHEIRFPSKDKKPTIISKVLYNIVILLLLLSFIMSSIFVATSRYNYPGGDALYTLHNHINHAVQTHSNNNEQQQQIQQQPFHVKVYIDNAAAMSGVNLYGQHAAILSNPNVQWTFDKDGYEIENSLYQNNKNNQNNNTTTTDWTKYTHLLTESKDLISTMNDDNNNNDGLFHIIYIAQGHPRFDISSFKIRTTDAIYVFERKDWMIR